MTIEVVLYNKMDTNIVMSNDSINVNQIDILPAEVHTYMYGGQL